MMVNALIRRGEISEIVGGLASGRTTLLNRCVCAVTRAGAVAALVDVDGTFDPGSAARAGVDLRRVLWVRGDGRRDRALRAADLLVRCPGFALVVLDVGETAPRVSLSAAYRFRLAVRRAGVTLLIVSRRRLTGGAATLCVETSRAGLAWAGPRHARTRLVALHSTLRVLRSRAGKDAASADHGGAGVMSTYGASADGASADNGGSGAISGPPTQ
jgi:recA bacterial DNA recombination protein